MKIKQDNFVGWISIYLIFIVTLFFGLKPFNFISKNDIRFDRDNEGGIRFNSSSLSAESSQRSIAFTKESVNIPPYSSLSIYLELKPERKPNGLGYIVEIHDDRFQPPLIIAQWQKSLIIRSRRSEAFIKDSYEEYGVRDCFINGETSTILISYQLGETNVYFNEKLISQKKDFDLIESHLLSMGRIIVGSNGVGESLWIGTVRYLALYKECLAPCELYDSVPFIEYDFSKFQNHHVPNLQGESFDLQIPKYYKSPITKRFAKISKWKKKQPGTSDITINILGFLPLGFATYALLNRRIKSRVIVFGTTCVVAFLFSLMIESLQTFLPSRHPSQIDLLCNSLGGFIAAFIAHFFYRSKSFKLLGRSAYYLNKDEV